MAFKLERCATWGDGSCSSTRHEGGECQHHTRRAHDWCGAAVAVAGQMNNSSNWHAFRRCLAVVVIARLARHGAGGFWTTSFPARARR
jgi:hypothetical protein